MMTKKEAKELYDQYLQKSLQTLLKAADKVIGSSIFDACTDCKPILLYPFKINKEFPEEWVVEGMFGQVKKAHVSALAEYLKKAGYEVAIAEEASDKGRVMTLQIMWAKE